MPPALLDTLLSILSSSEGNEPCLNDNAEPISVNRQWRHTNTSENGWMSAQCRKNTLSQKPASGRCSTINTAAKIDKISDERSQFGSQDINLKSSFSGLKSMTAPEPMLETSPRRTSNDPESHVPHSDRSFYKDGVCVDGNQRILKENTDERSDRWESQVQYRNTHTSDRPMVRRSTMEPITLVEALTEMLCQITARGDPFVLLQIMSDPYSVMETILTPECVQGRVTREQLTELLYQYIRLSLRDGAINLPGPFRMKFPDGVGWVWSPVAPPLHVILPDTYYDKISRPQSTSSQRYQYHTISSANKQSRPHTSVSPRSASFLSHLKRVETKTGELKRQKKEALNEKPGLNAPNGELSSKNEKKKVGHTPSKNVQLQRTPSTRSRKLRSSRSMESKVKREILGIFNQSTQYATSALKSLTHRLCRGTHIYLSITFLYKINPNFAKIV